MNKIIHYSIFKTRFGLCLVASTGKGVCNILFADNSNEAIDDLSSRWEKTPVVKKVLPEHAEVKDYFLSLPSKSKIKLDLIGTDFQRRVWKALVEIPIGETTSYGVIAEKIGDKKLSRAVGAAIGSNPIGYLIPCHRVLKSTGEIGGYRWGIERKKAMLEYEMKGK